MRVSFHCRELSSSGVDVVGVDAVVCDVIATPAQVSAAAVLEVAGVLPEAAMDGLWAAIASNSFDRLEETLEDIFLEVQHALWPLKSISANPRRILKHAGAGSRAPSQLLPR